MTGKTETQYQHQEPRPGSNYRTLFLKGRRIERRWSTKPSMDLRPVARKNSRRTIRSPSRRSLRLSTMSPKISRSSSKSGTARRQGSAPEVPSGPRTNEGAARRESE